MIVAVRAYGMEAHPLLDTGAVPNVMSWDFLEKLALAPMDTNRQVSVADETVAQVVGKVHKIAVSFGTLVVFLGFFVVRNAPFDAIIGSPTLEYIEEYLYNGHQQVAFTLGRKEVLLLYPSELPVVGGRRNDREDFTSTKESGSEKFAP